MTDLPPMKTIVKNEAEFFRLVSKLLKHLGRKERFDFRPIKPPKGHQSSGYVLENFPGVKCPVLFYFNWSEKRISSVAKNRQIRNLLNDSADAGRTYRSFVLVSIPSLNPEDEKWLKKLVKSYGDDKTAVVKGEAWVLYLLNRYPAIKKYHLEGQKSKLQPDKNIFVLKNKYEQWTRAKFNHLDFVGLPTGQYKKQSNLIKPELERIYIPLKFQEKKDDGSTFNLDKLLQNSKRTVVLGNPGSGKSTLSKYLAVVSCQKRRKGRLNIKPKTPFFISLKEFEQQRSEKEHSFDFLDYLTSRSRASNFPGLENVDRDFFIALLEMERTLVIFDGLDEIYNREFRIYTAQKINAFAERFPDSRVWITSRILGFSGQVKKKLNRFDQYYLAQALPNQKKEFIENWYKIQEPVNHELRKKRIQSLQRSVETNPGVKHLTSNPLLLTMVTLVHWFEGNLPDNRATLYEKCIRLLLETWQMQKEPTASDHVLRKRGMKYDDQLRLLAVAAFQAQQTPGKKGDSTGIIEKNELSRILLDNWYDKKRMSMESAQNDIDMFLEYVLHRSGLLVNEGSNEQGDHQFSFIHHSFQEYLWACRVAWDRSITQDELIGMLLNHMGDTGWSEPILLTLHLMAASSGNIFIDRFTLVAFERLKHDGHDGWFLMARGVRDNINFAPGDIREILGKVVDIWLNIPEDETAQTILTEISQFSQRGKKVLIDIVKTNVAGQPAAIAFRFFSLYRELFGIDSSILAEVAKNKECDQLYPFILLYRKDHYVRHFIENINLSERHWLAFFESVPDETLENLGGLIRGGMGPAELTGYILNSWRGILREFHNRNSFLKQERGIFEKINVNDHLHFKFSGYAGICCPFVIFKAHVKIRIKTPGLETIDSGYFLKENRNLNDPPVKFHIQRWMKNSIQDMIDQFKCHPSFNNNNCENDLENLVKEKHKVGKQLLKEIEKDIRKGLVQEFLKDRLHGLGGDMLRHFLNSLGHYLSGEFLQNFLQDFNGFFINRLKKGRLMAFNRELGKFVHQDCVKELLTGRIQNLSHSIRKELNRLFLKENLREPDWGEISGEELEKLTGLYSKEIDRGNNKFIDAFFLHLYEELFSDHFHVSFEPETACRKEPFLQPGGQTVFLGHLSLSNVLTIPFTLVFILSAALCHYLLNILTHLDAFYRDISVPTETDVLRLVETYCDKHPFSLYLAYFSLDMIAEDFSRRNRRGTVRKTNLELAAFIANAAKISLLTGKSCKGKSWEQIIEKSERQPDNDLFTAISLALYKLSTFQNREASTHLLTEYLELLKIRHPHLYSLLIEDKSG